MKKGWKQKMTGLVVLVGAGLVAVLYYFPPAFLTLREVVVSRPPKTLTEQALIQLSGVHVGQNLLTLSLGEVRENLRRYRWIHDVRLSKSFPGRLIVDVQEEEPVALVALEDLYFVNHAGRLFKKMAGYDPKDLPVISGFSREDFEQGQALVSNRLQEVVALTERLHQSAVVRQMGLSEVHWEEGQGVSVLTLHPYLEISLGTQHWDEKWGRLQQNLDTLASRIKFMVGIDLNYERKIVVRTKT